MLIRALKKIAAEALSFLFAAIAAAIFFSATAKAEYQWFRGPAQSCNVRDLATRLDLNQFPVPELVYNGSNVLGLGFIGASLATLSDRINHRSTADDHGITIEFLEEGNLSLSRTLVSSSNADVGLSDSQLDGKFTYLFQQLHEMASRRAQITKLGQPFVPDHRGLSNLVTDFITTNLFPPALWVGNGEARRAQVQGVLRSTVYNSLGAGPITQAQLAAAFRAAANLMIAETVKRAFHTIGLNEDCADEWVQRVLAASNIDLSQCLSRASGVSAAADCLSTLVEHSEEIIKNSAYAALYQKVRQDSGNNTCGGSESPMAETIANHYSSCLLLPRPNTPSCSAVHQPPRAGIRIDGRTVLPVIISNREDISQLSRRAINDVQRNTLPLVASCSTSALAEYGRQRLSTQVASTSRREFLDATSTAPEDVRRCIEASRVSNIARLESVTVDCAFTTAVAQLLPVTRVIAAQMLSPVFADQGTERVTREAQALSNQVGPNFDRFNTCMHPRSQLLNLQSLRALSPRCIGSLIAGASGDIASYVLQNIIGPKIPEEQRARFVDENRTRVHAEIQSCMRTLPQLNLDSENIGTEISRLQENLSRLIPECATRVARAYVIPSAVRSYAAAIPGFGTENANQFWRTAAPSVNATVDCIGATGLTPSNLSDRIDTCMTRNVGSVAYSIGDYLTSGYLAQTFYPDCAPQETPTRRGAQTCDNRQTNQKRNEFVRMYREPVASAIRTCMVDNTRGMRFSDVTANDTMMQQLLSQLLQQSFACGEQAVATFSVSHPQGEGGPSEGMVEHVARHLIEPIYSNEEQRTIAISSLNTHYGTCIRNRNITPPAARSVFDCLNDITRRTTLEAIISANGPNGRITSLAVGRGQWDLATRCILEVRRQQFASCLYQNSSVPADLDRALLPECRNVTIPPIEQAQSTGLGSASSAEDGELSRALSAMIERVRSISTTIDQTNICIRNYAMGIINPVARAAVTANLTNLTTDRQQLQELNQKIITLSTRCLTTQARDPKSISRGISHFFTEDIPLCMDRVIEGAVAELGRMAVPDIGDRARARQAAGCNITSVELDRIDRGARTISCIAQYAGPEFAQFNSDRSAMPASLEPLFQEPSLASLPTNSPKRPRRSTREGATPSPIAQSFSPYDMIIAGLEDYLTTTAREAGGQPDVDLENLLRRLVSDMGPGGANRDRAVCSLIDHMAQAPEGRSSMLDSVIRSVIRVGLRASMGQYAADQSVDNGCAGNPMSVSQGLMNQLLSTENINRIYNNEALSKVIRYVPDPSQPAGSPPAPRTLRDRIQKEVLQPLFCGTASERAQIISDGRSIVIGTGGANATGVNLNQIVSDAAVVALGRDRATSTEPRVDGTASNLEQVVINEVITRVAECKSRGPLRTFLRLIKGRHWSCWAACARDPRSDAYQTNRKVHDLAQHFLVDRVPADEIQRELEPLEREVAGALWSCHRRARDTTAAQVHTNSLAGADAMGACDLSAIEAQSPLCPDIDLRTHTPVR